jgi:Tol biopolymer transport system component
MTSDKQFGEAVWYPMFSPDGNNVLFKASLTPGYHDRDLDFVEAPHNRSLGLDMVNLTISSKSSKAVTKDASGYGSACWSPDSKQVTVVMTGWPPYDQIFSIQLKNRKAIRLVRCSKVENVTDIFWSNDSRKVMFQLWTGQGYQDPNLYAVPRYGGKRILVVKGKSDRSLYSFSPDNKHAAFIQDESVYVANANGSDAHQIISRSHKDKHTDWLRPLWSKDGNRLILAEVTCDTGDTGCTNYMTEIHDYNIITQRNRIAATLNENVTAVIWSRDSKWLISKILRSGNTEIPDAKTEWYMYHREGLMAVNVADGSSVTLKEPNEETKGLDWFELPVKS